jgi:hypothetical protein
MSLSQNARGCDPLTTGRSRLARAARCDAEGGRESERYGGFLDPPPSRNRKAVIGPAVYPAHYSVCAAALGAAARHDFTPTPLWGEPASSTARTGRTDNPYGLRTTGRAPEHEMRSASTPARRPLSQSNHASCPFRLQIGAWKGAAARLGLASQMRRPRRPPGLPSASTDSPGLMRPTRGRRGFQACARTWVAAPR